jgi:hypothetical protein
MSKFTLGGISVDLVPDRQYRIMKNNLNSLSAALARLPDAVSAKDIERFEKTFGTRKVADCLQPLGNGPLAVSGAVRTYAFCFSPADVAKMPAYRDRFRPPHRGSKYVLIADLDYSTRRSKGRKGQLVVLGKTPDQAVQLLL